MPNSLSYSDAVKLLSGSGPVGRAVDNLLGGVLSVATAGGSDLAISLFDAKTEVIRLGGLVAAKIGDSVRGLGRHERSERLQAAHAVLVVAAFFEEADACLAGSGLRVPAFTRDEQLGLVAGAGQGTLVDRLPAVPLPSPDVPYETLLGHLRAWFAGEAARLAAHLPGLAVWDEADERARRTVTGLLERRLPGAAVDRYDEVHRRLAGEIPEFALWADRLEARATARGLHRLEELLLSAASGRAPGRQRAALARVYRAELDRPVLGGDTGDQPLPTLGAAYLDPRFRVKAAGRGAHPADEQWWRDAPMRTDFAAFLAVHLTTTRATEAPMLLLGQPGAGKSSLTRIFAARLPAGDFFACRVALREVPAEAEIQDQVEGALRHAIGETVSWAELSRDAGGALPVILLDGFDELLQAAGRHHSGYLQRVARFQQREAALGRPVAVLVTTRIAVADRARLPAGALAVRLEPFDGAQIERWLSVWNATGGLARPLAPELALRYRILAEQPLLLLMLALYHATGNALPDGAAIEGGQLYERLLASFAEREVRRVHGAQPEAAVPELVEQELLRLSVVAFAMFHRLRLWITEGELDADLDGLGIAASPAGRGGALRGSLTAGQEMVGRFFFIQRAQAVLDDHVRRTYEFLHATFGEYLVARLVVRAVRDAQARTVPGALASSSGTPGGGDDLLRSLLGFTPLTARATVVRFVKGLLDGPGRDEVRAWLVDRTAEALTRPRYAESRYRPVAKRIDHWMATYSFNLLLLTAACGADVRASELFPGEDDPAALLRNSALQWQAAVPGDMWMDAIEVLRVTRVRHEGRRDIVLCYTREWAPDFPEPVDVYWLNRREPGGRGEEGFEAAVEMATAVRSMVLTNHLSDDALLHAVEPLLHLVPGALTRFSAHAGDHRSVAHSLVRMWVASSLDEALAAYAEVAEAATDLRRGGLPVECRGATELLLGAMRADAHRMPPETVLRIVGELVGGAILSPVAASSAVHCLVTSGAAGDPPGARLVSDLRGLSAGQAADDDSGVLEM
ncbi:hypothetical protein Asp14428_16010 [Actinoplanes sp. NBRC 14428]|nr:hypothetical protein Asp14428_16010 [Actinoplanes sp. NBRC 14428]